MLRHEVTPGRDDPGRVQPDLVHVREAHSSGIRAEVLLQQPDLRCAQDRKRRLARDHAVSNERRQPGQELALLRVEESLVTEARRPPMIRNYAHDLLEP